MVYGPVGRRNDQSAPQIDHFQFGPIHKIEQCLDRGDAIFRGDLKTFNLAFTNLGGRWTKWASNLLDEGDGKIQGRPLDGFVRSIQYDEIVVWANRMHRRCCFCLKGEPIAFDRRQECSWFRQRVCHSPPICAISHPLFEEHAHPTCWFHRWWRFWPVGPIFLLNLLHPLFSRCFSAEKSTIQRRHERLYPFSARWQRCQWQRKLCF